MDYIFVSISTRVGSKTLVGPVTKTKWVIKPSGSWIAKADEALLEEEIPYYCWRAGRFLTTRIYETSPSLRHMMAKPK